MFQKTVPVNIIFTAARTSHSRRQKIIDDSLLKKRLYLQWHIYFWNHMLTYLLSPWSRVLLEKLIGFRVFRQSRNSPHFMEPEGSLPHSQVGAIYPYPEPARSSTFGIMYCLCLQKYLNMCSNILVSILQRVCSNVLLSEVMNLYLKWLNIKAHSATHSKQPHFLPLVVCAIFLAKYPHSFLSSKRKGAFTARLEWGRGYAMETRELCSIPDRGRDFPLFYSIHTGTGYSGLLPSECCNFFLWR